MKIIFPADENKKNICVSFGRTPLFMLYDTETGKEEFIVNPGAEAESGAGIKAAQAVCDSGAEALITVRCGENAAEVFNAAGIKIYKSEGTDIALNIEKFKNNGLEVLTHFHAGYHGIR